MVPKSIILTANQPGMGWLLQEYLLHELEVDIEDVLGPIPDGVDALGKYDNGEWTISQRIYQKVSGNGYVDGNAYGYGDGYGNGNGSGNGNAYGYGYVDGNASGYGSGYGNISGNGEGYGYGD